MTRSLADFRIENDKVVLLSFVDGKEYRVHPADLHRHLQESDLAKVQSALQLRKTFIKRVLPPTAMSVLLASIIGLGAYDAYRMSHMADAPKSYQATDSLDAKVAPSNAPGPSTAQLDPPSPISTQPAASSSEAQPVSPVPAVTKPALTVPTLQAPAIAPIVEPLLNLSDGLIKPLLDQK